MQVCVHTDCAGALSILLGSAVQGSSSLQSKDGNVTGVTMELRTVNNNMQILMRIACPSLRQVKVQSAALVVSTLPFQLASNKYYVCTGSINAYCKL